MVKLSKPIYQTEETKPIPMAGIKSKTRIEKGKRFEKIA